MKCVFPTVTVHPQQLSTMVECDDCVNYCCLQLSQFTMTHLEQLKIESDNEIEDLKP